MQNLVETPLMVAEFTNTNTVIGSKMYGLSSQSLLVVRRRPHVVMGGGFVVADSSPRTLFRVDGCGINGRSPKEGFVQVLHVHRQWRGFASDHEGPRRLAFILKDPPKLCFPFSKAIRIWTQPRMNNGKDWDFESRGYFPDKDCSIVAHQGTIMAQIGVRREDKELMTTSHDLYHVVVGAGVDQAFVVGIIAVLDSIYG